MASLQTLLLDWYHASRRTFPWRGAPTPYRVWISEIMLQQTQAERVVDYFNRWMETFPDIDTLADGHEETVLKLWEGLGYYRRARNIMLAARIIRDDFQGRLPDTKKELLGLPGIGPYTAGAILSLAFNRNEPIVDANVERVFARLFDLDIPLKEKEARSFLWNKAAELIPPGMARDFNQALMELGALICGKKPDCTACPLSDRCESLRLGITQERPVPGKKKDIIPVTVVTGVLVHQGRIFIQKRRPDDVWGGLWEYPGGCPEQEESFETALRREYMEETGFTVRVRKKLAAIRHGYTRYRVTLHCYLLHLDGPPDTLPAPVLTEATEHLWADLNQIRARAFPAGHRKLTDMFLADPALLNG